LKNGKSQIGLLSAALIGLSANRAHQGGRGVLPNSAFRQQLLFGETEQLSVSPAHHQNMTVAAGLQVEFKVVAAAAKQK
jgi:hypothetical protein